MARRSPRRFSQQVRACALPASRPRRLRSIGAGILTAAGHGDNIPGQGYSFRQLLEAQALGDFRALEAAGRRAVFVRLTGDREAGLEALAKELKS